jgi:hypothetical protein
VAKAEQIQNRNRLMEAEAALVSAEKEFYGEKYVPW